MNLSLVSPRPACAALFWGFASVGLRGFGGVLPWVRRMLVEERRWLDEQGFTELLSLGQLMPGPNAVNMAVVFGARQRGLRGALAAVAGLMSAPVAIVLLLAETWRVFAGLPGLQAVLAAIGACAAGMMLATGLRMARQIERKPWPVLLAVGTFVAVAILRVPLLAVLALAAPLGILLARRDQRWGDRP